MRRLLILPLLLLASTLRAQPGGDDDNLYIPPELTIGWGRSSEPFAIHCHEYPFAAENELLPFLFFDAAADAIIPERYQVFATPGAAVDYADTSAIAGLSYESYPGGYWGENKYHQILNIIGFRMARSRSATLLLRGGYAAEPGETPAVAAARAASVRDYLVEIWRIDRDRITIAAPQLSSEKTDDILRHEEARHVRFISDDPSLLAPVTYTKRERTLHPLHFVLRLTPHLPADSVRSIEVVVMIADRIVARTTVPGDPDSSSYALRGTLELLEVGPPYLPESLSIQAVVETDGGRRASNVVSVPSRLYEYEGENSESSRSPRRELYYAHDDTALSDEQKRIVAELVGRFPGAARLFVRVECYEMGWAENAGGSSESEAERYLRLTEGRRWRPRPESRWSIRIDPPMTKSTLEVERKDLDAVTDWSDEDDVTAESAVDSTPPPPSYARGSVLLRHLRDALGVVVANETWSQLSGYKRNCDMRTTIAGFSFSPSWPEDRWYGRCVAVTIDGEETIRRFEEERTPEDANGIRTTTKW